MESAATFIVPEDWKPKADRRPSSELAASDDHGAIVEPLLSSPDRPAAMRQACGEIGRILIHGPVGIDRISLDAAAMRLTGFALARLKA